MKKIILSNLLLWTIMSGFSQVESNFSAQRTDTIQHASYATFSFGGGYSSFRDFATSPLIYEGISQVVDLGYLKIRPKRQTDFGIAYTRNLSHINTNNEETMSNVHSATIKYGMLFNVPKLSYHKWKTRVGGEFNITGNYRYNPSLGNNSVGLEAIGTLFGTTKISYNFYKKIRSISYLLKIGVLNTNYRNGYAYVNQVGISDDAKSDYKFNLFSGFRISSELDMLFFLKTKNAMRVSYVWDAYKTGKEFDTFEMAGHHLKFTFLFKTK